MQNNKLIILSILGAALLIGGVLFFSPPSNSRLIEDDTTGDAPRKSGVGQATVVDGVQYIDIMARGGYSPRVTKAQAGVPTVLRMKTENTYDCSSALVINDLGYQSYLPATGVTEIQVPVEKTQGTLQGMCSMAMYHFQVDFE